MASLPEPLVTLVAALSRLPGIGPRSAERIALHIVQSDARSVADLAQALVAARQNVTSCTRCGTLTQEQPCRICSDPKRDCTILCVVERPVDVISLEKSGQFHGRYHVLGGKISPLNGVGPEDLRIGSLLERVATEAVKEVILALPSDVEGDATSHYLARILKPKEIRVSRIAQGLPVGSGLDYADELTLSRALEGRRAVDVT